MTGLDLQGLGRVVLLVRDFARSVAFYEGTLGLAKVQRRPGWAVFDAGGVLLCLRGPWEGMPFDAESFGRSPDELLFVVADVAAARTALVARGVEVQPIHEPGPGIRVAELRDPDGRRIGIEQRGGG